MPVKLTQKKDNRTVSGSSAEKQPSTDGVIAPKKTTFNYDIWRSFSAGILRSMGRLALEGDYENDPAYLEALDMFEIENNKRATDYGSAVVAGQALEEWLGRTEWVYEAPTLFVATGFHVSLSVPVGSGTVTLGMDYSSVGQEPEVSMRAAYDYLQAAVKATFPANKAAEKSKINTQDKSSKVVRETVNCDALVAKEWNGKTVYRLMPSEGKWTQFGLALYKDVAKTYGVDLPDVGEEQEVNWEVTYELKDDGTPSRVTSIRNVD